MSDENNTFETLEMLGFRASADSMRALIAQLTKSKSSPIQTCEKLAALERHARDSHNLNRRTRTATIGTHRALDTFDWNHPKTIDKPLFEELLEMSFIERSENVLLRGQSGVGKTMLAQNLGLTALAQGHTVRFATLAGVLADLLKQESVPALERRMRRYVRPQLLIIDELGYVPCDNRSADLLYNIINRRHERASTVITTNLAFKQWAGVFPGATSVAALVDRFAQHLHVIDIDADSWRQTKSEPPPTKPTRKR